VLDVAVIHLFNATFAELRPGERMVDEVPPLDSLHRYGMNMRPADYVRGSESSPVFSYPYTRTREVLEHLKGHSEWDPCHGLKMEYIDPTSGGPAIPTISTAMQLLPAGFQSQPYRSTAGTIFCVVEGSGSVEVGEADAKTTLRYGPWDIFVVPSWMPHIVHADSETTVFSASDETIQRKLGFFREERM
jgi:gentisate 1,2-dioxygenase